MVADHDMEVCFGVAASPPGLLTSAPLPPPGSPGSPGSPGEGWLQVEHFSDSDREVDDLDCVFGSKLPLQTAVGRHFLFYN